ncbi:MAG TPA: molybdopterin-guanine dinucleotide biosynthesis protein B [Ramlibacter sp.]
MPERSHAGDMRVVGIVGHSGMGKTTLLERLIPELAGRGLCVSLIKHSHKDIDLDQRGKDSWRLREAGCHDVVVAGRNRWGVVHELRDRREPDLAELLAAVRPCHLVLVEGMRSAPFPKLEVWRPSVGKPLTRADGVFAVATDCPDAVRAALPAVPLDDTAAIADLVWRPEVSRENRFPVDVRATAAGWT